MLDTRFFGYFSDVDFGCRADLAGFKLVCAKGAWLYHHGAGHVKGELEKRKTTSYEALHKERMGLVNDAYQEFRKKWNIATSRRLCGGDLAPLFRPRAGARRRGAFEI